MKKISKEEAKKLKNGTMYIIYNPLTDRYKEVKASKKDIAHSQFAYEKLEYYIKEDEID